jgi:hypothetical protein
MQFRQVRVKGELLCSIAPINSLVLSEKVDCEESAPSVGDPRLVVYYNDKGELVNVADGLLANEAGGEFEMSGEDSEPFIGYELEEFMIMG